MKIEIGFRRSLQALSGGFLLLASGFVLAQEPAAAVATPAAAPAAKPAPSSGPTLNILNWDEYIGPDVVSKFQKATGIKVNYEIMESDEDLHERVLAGGSGFDVVYPTASYLDKQAKAGVYEALDWSRIPNRAHLGKQFMKRLSPTSAKYGAPYAWGTEGLIVNLTKVRQVFGDESVPMNFDLIFKPENAAKLKKCGIGMLDSQTAFVTMLSYMGRDPNSQKLADTQDAYKELLKVRSSIKLFSYSTVADFLAGKVCASTGWSGDYKVLQRRAREAGSKDEIRYIAPPGQTGMWFTMMAIPKDAANKDAAYKWINFMLGIKIAAENTEHITYTTAVTAAKAYIPPELADDQFLYPGPAAIANYFTYNPVDDKLREEAYALWEKFKANK